MVQIAIPYAYGCTVRVYAYGMYHTRTVRNTRTVSNNAINNTSNGSRLTGLTCSKAPGF